MKGRYHLKLIALSLGIGLATLYPSIVQAQTAQQVAQNALPSVVLIVARPAKGKSISLGSGFFVDTNVVATAYHVINGSSSLFVKSENEIHKVTKVLGVDNKNDLALLQVTDFEGPPLDLADDPDTVVPQWKTPEGFELVTSLSVGDEVYAIGNPEGLEGTFSQGIVSGIRFIGKKTYIQITAPISHGSSGGPVLNKQGEVVGIAVGTLKVGQNLNFAIPVSDLRALISTSAASASQKTTKPPIPLSDLVPVESSSNSSKSAEAVRSLSLEIQNAAIPLLNINKELIEMAQRRVHFDFESAMDLSTLNDHIDAIFQLADQASDILFMYSYISEKTDVRKEGRIYALDKIERLMKLLAQNQKQIANDLKTIKIDRVKELAAKVDNQIEQIFALFRKANNLP